MLRCLDIIIKNGTKYYTTINCDNEVIYTFSQYELFMHMADGTAIVTNLKLTSDGKIIECREETSKVQKFTDDELNKIINKLLFLGYKKIDMSDYIALVSGDNLVMIIPNSTKYCRSKLNDLEVSLNNKNIVVIGGRNLRDANRLFIGKVNETVNTLDLSRFDTSNVVTMHAMFSGMKANKIMLGNLFTNYVTDMESMFAWVNTDTLDLSNLCTPRLLQTSLMFYNCHINNLKFGNFYTGRVTRMSTMFFGSEIGNIDGLKFDFRNVKYADRMFAYCKTPKIDLSNSKMNSATTVSEMFSNSSIHDINLSNADLSNSELQDNMFYNCSADIVDLRNLNIGIKPASQICMFKDAKIGTLCLLGIKVRNHAKLFKEVSAGKIDELIT
ncbi:MAG: BspA family leucine-rich repeat surface protein [Lachnospiraceae bacterium]|nr:BspA family leucine-rich repeat surface protein [Lachnospiraceae bacterium]